MIDKNPEVVKQLTNKKLFGQASFQLQNEVRNIDEKCDQIKVLSQNIKDLVELIQKVGTIIKM